MCFFYIIIYLHCMHGKITPVRCPDAALSLSSNFDEAKYQRLPTIDECRSHTNPEAHSYFLCCPACRNAKVHKMYPLQDHHIPDRPPTTKCCEGQDESTTFPTCWRRAIFLMPEDKERSQRRNEPGGPSSSGKSGLQTPEQEIIAKKESGTEAHRPKTSVKGAKAGPEHDSERSLIPKEKGPKTTRGKQHQHKPSQPHQPTSPDPRPPPPPTSLQAYHTCFISFLTCHHSTHLPFMPAPSFTASPIHILPLPFPPQIRPTPRNLLTSRTTLPVLSCGCYMGHVPHTQGLSMTLSALPHKASLFHPEWEVEGECFGCRARWPFQNAMTLVRSKAQEQGQEQEQGSSAASTAVARGVGAGGDDAGGSAIAKAREEKEGEEERKKYKEKVDRFLAELKYFEHLAQYELIWRSGDSNIHGWRNIEFSRW